MDVFALTVDVVSTALFLLVAIRFGRMWRLSREGLELIYALGLIIQAVSFAGLAAWRILDRPPHILLISLSTQLGGSLVLLFGYVSRRVHGSPRLWIALGWTTVALVLMVTVLLTLVPWIGSLPDIPSAGVVIHGFATASFAGIAMMASLGFSKHRVLARALVPGAFLAMAVSNYTWLLGDLTRYSDPVVNLALTWRLGASVLLALAAYWSGRRSRAAA